MCKEPFFFEKEKKHTYTRKLTDYSHEDVKFRETFYACAQTHINFRSHRPTRMVKNPVDATLKRKVRGGEQKLFQPLNGLRQSFSQVKRPTYCGQ